MKNSSCKKQDYRNISHIAKTIIWSITFQSNLVMFTTNQKIRCRNSLACVADYTLYEVNPVSVSGKYVWLRRLFSVFRLLFVSICLSNSEQI